MGITPKTKEAASAGTEATSRRKTLSKSYQSRLQMSSKSLRELRTVHGITPAAIVQELKKYYPSFDRSMLSKAENGGKWGIVLSEEIIQELYQTLVPDSPADFRTVDTHRLTRRISVRLTEEDFKAITDVKDHNGYDTMQEFLTAVVRKIAREGI